jgi:hypothetical protein
MVAYVIFKVCKWQLEFAKFIHGYTERPHVNFVVVDLIREQESNFWSHIALIATPSNQFRSNFAGFLAQTEISDLHNDLTFDADSVNVLWLDISMD